MGQSLIDRPLYGSRKEEASFADSRLNALTLCHLEMKPNNNIISILNSMVILRGWGGTQERPCRLTK